MPGDEFYQTAEIQAMRPDEFAEAQARGWRRPMATAGERGEVKVSAPEPEPEPEPYGATDANAWAKNRDVAEVGEDFTAPSGQKCRLRRLEPEELIRVGILDRVTRLEGLAEQLVQNAQGLPPGKERLPNREDMELLLETLDLLLPIAVAVPKVYANDDAEAPADAIRVQHIDLMDRVAIMEYSIRKLKMMDRFRNAR
jgi:hypothetical protein